MNTSAGKAQTRSRPEGSRLRWVGLFLVLAWCTGCWPGGEETPVTPDQPPVAPPSAVVEASDTLSLFDQFRLQETHQEFQKSYLDLVRDIQNQPTAKVDILERRPTISRYTRSRKNYADVLKKISEAKKEERLKCFATMKSLIRGILFYDQKTKKKTSRYDPERLVKEGIFTTAPTCPSGGKYSIISRDGRRFFHCDIHGTLRQN